MVLFYSKALDEEWATKLHATTVALVVQCGHRHRYSIVELVIIYRHLDVLCIDGVEVVSKLL